jgi:LacI family transcriptional regulator
MVNKVQRTASPASATPEWMPAVTVRHRRVLLALGWYAEALHSGVARYAKTANWALDASLLHDFEPSPDWYGDGIIWVAGVNPALDRFVRRWHKPVVNIGYTPTPGIPRVTSDPDAVMQMAVEHFQSRGFEHYAFYLHVDRPGPQVKMRAYETAVKATEGTFHLIDLPKARKHQQPHAQRAVYRWLADAIRQCPQPLAVVAETDDPAIMILHACVEAGIRVPEQVAVLGINDDPLRCPLASIALSSIDDNMEQIGFKAAAILDDLMSGKTADSVTLIPPRGLTIRQSTDMLAVNNAPVAEALKLIKTQFREPVSAQSIAREIPISQRQLHTEFVHIVGRSIAEELARMRTNYAVRLLLSTDWKVSVIAHQSGLTNANRLCRTFKKIHGQTPLAFRRQAPPIIKDV